MKTVAIIGGGLAGLISGIELSKKGVPCTLFEKNRFPFHRVCGEYVSNEAVPYLKKNNLYPGESEPSQINRFLLSTTRGQTATMPLDLGGFGISRYTFDNFLKQKAEQTGVTVLEQHEVTDIIKENDQFQLLTPSGAFSADVVLGAFGKRSKLDGKLDRIFFRKKSPYVGIKYHVRTNHPPDLIALHNFRGGYCGVVNVERGITNICYLVDRDLLQQYRSVQRLEENMLYKNPLLKELLAGATHLFEKPLVINEISFQTKGPLEKGLIMAGDSAGMIAPLCGNGMAMAIHSGKLAAEKITRFCSGEISRRELEQEYSLTWRKNFQSRLWAGRTIQRLFGNDFFSDLSVKIMINSERLAKWVMIRTHGEYF